MKVTLMGDMRSSYHFHKPGVSWSLWLDEDYVIASGQSVSVDKAEKAANKAFDTFKRALERQKKPIKLIEWA